MAQAKRDQNHVPTLIGTADDDGITPLLLTADPTTHVLDVNDSTTGSDLSNDIAARDQNRVPVLMAVSSVDGVTPVAVYVDASTNELLIDST